MRLRSVSLCVGVMLVSSMAFAFAQDAPVVLNPMHADEGYMFDWIFFAIMVPIPAFLLWDEIRNRLPGSNMAR